MSTQVLEVRGLRKAFPLKSGVFGKTTGMIHAVDGIDVDVFPNETLGLVGESGCGKTTFAKLILMLEKADAGTILFEGKDITKARGTDLKEIHKGMQVIFQDPFGSLNPRKKIFPIIAEPLMIHGFGSREDIVQRTVELIEMVGLSEDMLSRYPHEFSGGQRQRICIARSLAVNPRLLICDEPVSALDVSIQAQVINLLVDLQTNLKLSYIFISHDLAVVGYLSHRIAVMYRGRIVELSDAQTLFSSPQHPYTRCLMEAVPEPIPQHRTGTVQNSFRDHAMGFADEGCPYSSTCPYVEDRCHARAPDLTERETGHFVACHRSL
ncbi:MAG: ABC transporter ATP-binding protein [Desulfomonilia bacterium]